MILSPYRHAHNELTRVTVTMSKVACQCRVYTINGSGTYRLEYWTEDSNSCDAQELKQFNSPTQALLHAYTQLMSRYLL